MEDLKGNFFGGGGFQGRQAGETSLWKDIPQPVQLGKDLD